MASQENDTQGYIARRLSEGGLRLASGSPTMLSDEFAQYEAARKIEMPALRDCPFCGGRPQSKTVAIRDGQTLSCRNYDCMAGVAAFNPNAAEKCFDRWNRRAEASA